MSSWEIKGLEYEQSVLKFLDGVIADYGVYIFVGVVFLLIPFLAWVLSGGLRRKLFKGKSVPHVTAVIGVHIPIGGTAPSPESSNPLPPLHTPSDCDHD